jgi:dTDP-4-amino-4,6-dideoxygalactose transaminase
VGEVSRLEEEFAAFTGAKYCVAVASGGYAMSCALRAMGVGHGDKVLSNGFTLAPVPGAIASVGAEPVFVETTEALTIDIDDLAAKARASGARVLLLSHMRGHICDMDRLMEVCDGLGAGDRGLRAHDGCGVERNALGAARAGGPATPRRPTSTSIPGRAG